MFKDRWKADSRQSSSGTGVSEAPLSRTSNGLDQFFAGLRDARGLSLLDFAGASQSNIIFISELGHRVYSDDIVRSLEQSFGDGDQSNPAAMEAFLQETLNFPEGHFDGALVWDSLQFLSPPLLQLTVDRLFHILRPGASLLAFFNSDEKATNIPVYSYRIAGPSSVQIAPRGQRRPAQFFNNRALEKLFQNFASVKFFLARDHLREVIVKR